jgi:hypothetical protein
MPQAPQGLTPTAQPGVYAPQVDLPVPVDAFGGAVGHALQTLGTDVEQSSDRIWARAMEMQGLKNETEAKNADAEYMLKSTPMRAEFLNREGVNAGPEALAKHINDLNSLRTSIRDGLSSPAAQKMYDGSSLGFMGREVFNAAGHSGQQMKVASNNAATSRIQLAKQNIGDNPDDEDEFSRGVNVIRNENSRKAQTGGWSPEQLDATNQRDVGEAIATRINGIANSNAIQAQRMLDLAMKKGAIDPIAAQQVQNTITNKFNQQGSKYISDKVLADRRNGQEENRPVQEYIDAGLEMAKGYGAKDPTFPDFVRKRIQTDYNQQMAVEQDTYNNNLRTVWQALGKSNPEGKGPTDEGQLRAIDPAVGPALDAVLSRNPKAANAIYEKFDQNARGVVTHPNDENTRTFYHWRTKLLGNDQDQSEFLAQDFASMHLTPTQQGQLQDMQKSKEHSNYIQAIKDPRVQRAMGMLETQLKNAGITDSAKDEDKRKDYTAFKGMLQDQLLDYQKEHPGKLPSTEELRTMFSQMVQTHVIGRHWYGTENQVPVYREAVPEADQKRILSDWVASRGTTPNAEEIARIYHGQQFNKYYKGKGAAAPAPAATPAPGPKPPVSE